jgi:hypothetical protein
MLVICTECFSPLDTDEVESVGLIQCECGNKLVREEEALTIVSEMPFEEYLGG